MSIHEGDADTRKCSEKTDEFLVPKIMEEGLRDLPQFTATTS